LANRSADWLSQAQKDYEQAVRSREAGVHEWACFIAQQAAEKAVRALHLAMGQEAWAHVVAKLLRELPALLVVPPDLVDRAMVLDNYYIPARYPDSHPEGAPFQHFGVLQSGGAIEHAGKIIEFVRSEVAKSR
jgi:HEPN domain-containing protein